MAVLSLPTTFSNSFWTQDYRKGVEVLYGQLEQSIGENTEIAAFIRTRAAAELAIAAQLNAPPPARSVFDVDDGASLLMAFRGLRAEAATEGALHESVAKELQTAVAEPFEKWAEGYKERLHGSKANLLDGWMYSYEVAQTEVNKLKSDYLTKTRKADEAEDDARFAPITHPVGDQYTSSPKLKPLGANPNAAPRAPQRQATMSERITQRLKEFRLNAGTQAHPRAAPKPDVQFDADIEEEKAGPKLDKGKGRATDSGASTPQRVLSPPPIEMPPAAAKVAPPKLETDPVPPPPLPPLDVAGISMTPTEVSELMKKAKEELPLRPVRFPLLGEYQDCFSGEEFASWLNTNVKAFEGNLDHAEVAARVLTEKYNLLRRLGELGNDFENADDSFYQFRPKAFTLDASPPPPKAAGAQVLTPMDKLSPLTQNIAERTGGLANLVSKAFAANTEPPYVRARRDAEVADQEYRVAVRKLDRQRLGLEERIEDTLKTLQKWELDRLRAVKTVLTQYYNTLAKVSKAYSTANETIEMLIASYQPEQDIKVLIERYRTGPFRPVAQVYESISHDESDVVFGIDLRRWADNAYWHVASPGEKREEAPPVLTALLGALLEAYPRLPNDAEKRKTWIYEVPLPAVHHLRETLNAVPPQEDIPQDMLQKYDAPVLASSVKLWALELDPPLCMYEGWDELRKLYPTVGSSAHQELKPSSEQHVLELQAALQKLPKIHLLVLDIIVKHLKDLIASTSESESESNEVYITKLALSMGRTILRPKQENEFSIQDRHPTLLFIDLLSKYDEIIPPAIAKKKRESERKVPVRRRTRPVDMRMSRSRISAGADLQALQAQQLAQRGIKGAKSPPPVPPVPHLNAAGLPQVPESPRPVTDEPLEMHEHEAAPQLTAEPEEFAEIPPPPKAEPGDIQLQDKRSSPIPAPPAPAPAPVHVDFSAIPPPPPIPAKATPPPPAHPVFKEPPPETDDVPARPQFKEPPPEPASPPRPARFVEPPVEDDAAPTPPPTAIPPTARRVSSPRVPTPPSGGSRSPSPVKPVSPGSGATTPTSESGRLARGPRLTRGPRPVSSLNRQSIVRPSSPGSPPAGSNGFPTANGGAGGANLRRAGSRTSTMSKRSSISRVSELSRRTMASDAEDEVLQ
ncbi:uncharacterized protein TRAVEDRAFT_29154 [Trametes versicolor FP-101664 SS1]|uniref:uncharacterized protein n=1 Tax=Trametes versicolor (strain FP-101664) TaxID=717944 RepID=UPI00046224F8|nr:uncharacterized protein TRAVEDRAFT_29154 [Trametes versicolor FP-101664 SS1]EIW58644.1 hypothetical protein TRAVEDRAFT_29154 [Trametes versicolor FP-101664 SS1]